MDPTLYLMSSAAKALFGLESQTLTNSKILITERRFFESVDNFQPKPCPSDFTV